MRKFSSYGPINTKLHYHVSREALINQAQRQLVGDAPDEGGHYITVWAPRQTGKTWVMQQVMTQIRASDDFEVAITTMQSAKEETTTEGVLKLFVRNLRNWFKQDFPTITAWDDLATLFTNQYFTKPVVLILDEFDALEETFINKFANQFRSIYTERLNETDKKSGEKTYLLHGLALIGVRSVLGIENVTGSPFNVQRSLHIPNLTFKEVEEMFKWHERESGQTVEQEVIERLFYETQGQPGLTCWFGELLTETYNDDVSQPITPAHFDRVFVRAANLLPNNNILNIISKARQQPYQEKVLDLFKTGEKILFRYDDRQLNFLYMNGVIDVEETAQDIYAKFASPFVQKRLFNYFANDLFGEVGRLYDPFESLEDTITEAGLNIKNLMRRYERYLRENREWLLKDAPRRTDLRIYEAVYHFNLYMYLQAFLRSYGGQVYPEFPTGNGQIDLLIQYSGQTYGLEVKSHTNPRDYQKALKQAVQYGKRLQLTEVSLVFFVEYVDEANRQKYEAVYKDKKSGVTVIPLFVETGN